MNFKTTMATLIGGLILLAMSNQSSANPIGLVEVTGRVGFSCATGTGQYEGLCPGDSGTINGDFKLIYDPLIPDTDGRQDYGLFRNSVRFFVLNVDQINRPDLTFTLVGRGDFSRTSIGYAEFANWKMILAEEHGFYDPSVFSFNVSTQRVGDVNQLPTLEFWSEHLTPSFSGGAGAVELDWLNSQTLQARMIPRPVPLPSSAWLMLIGIAALANYRNRFKYRLKEIRDNLEVNGKIR